MTRRFKRPSVIPPGGRYFFTDPTTGFHFISPTMEGLVSDITSHRQANNLEPIPNLELVVEEFICNNVDDSFCTEAPSRKTKCTLSYRSIMDATMILLHAGFRRGQAAASQSEAELRASICSVCPKNTAKSYCTTCSGIMDVVMRWIGRRHTRQDDRLGVCLGCCCILRAKVHIATDVLAKTRTPASEFDASCWMRPILGEDDAKI